MGCVNSLTEGDIGVLPVCEKGGMAERRKVLTSYNLPGQEICVDIFERADGTFGFEEHRRDVEDQRGWFAVGRYESLVFPSKGEALCEAQVRISWLGAQLGLG